MVKDDRHRTRALVYRTGRRVGAADGLADDRSGAEEQDRCGRGQATSGQVDGYAEISLKGKPMLFKYIGRMQEEVHLSLIHI